MLCIQESEQVVMQYSRKLDTYGDCEITSELGEALLALVQDTGFSVCTGLAGHLGLTPVTCRTPGSACVRDLQDTWDLHW